MIYLPDTNINIISDITNYFYNFLPGERGLLERSYFAYSEFGEMPKRGLWRGFYFLRGG